MSMTKTDDLLEGIRAQLVDGVADSNRRRSRRRAAAAIPVVGILAGLVATVGSGGDEPAYALTERPDGSVEVALRPEFDDVGELQAELIEAGVDASVVQLRAHPSMEGLVEVVSHRDEATGAVEHTDGKFVIDVAEAEGPVEILVYSETDPGELFQASPSLFRDGQPLAGRHCAFNDRPLPSSEVEAWLSEIGVAEVSWTVFGEADPETGAIDFEEFNTRPDGSVSEVRMQSADTAWVVVDPDGLEAATEVILMHDGTHETEYPTCSDFDQ